MHVVLFDAHVFGVRTSIGWVLGQELRVRMLTHAAFFFSGIGLNLLDVVVVPGCSWVVHIYSFFAQLFQLLNLEWGGHWRLQRFVLVEFMGYQVLSHQ